MPLTDVPQPYHRWKSNEDPNHTGGLTFDRCLACGVTRFPAPLNREAQAKAAGACPAAA